MCFYKFLKNIVENLFKLKFHPVVLSYYIYLLDWYYHIYLYNFSCYAFISYGWCWRIDIEIGRNVPLYIDWYIYNIKVHLDSRWFSRRWSSEYIEIRVEWPTRPPNNRYMRSKWPPGRHHPQPPSSVAFRVTSAPRDPLTYAP